MSVIPRIAFAVLLAAFFQGHASAQINGESIATYISQDSGNPREQYLEYGYRLATTLKLLTPQQLARVFGKATNIQVPETLNQLLEMGDVNFEGGSASLSPDALSELDKVAEYLAFSPKAKISVEGHAWYHDNRAQSLSEERALAAMNYLTSLGISADRIETAGYGADRPLVEGVRSETTANRRIEIRVLEDD